MDAAGLCGCVNVISWVVVFNNGFCIRFNGFSFVRQIFQSNLQISLIVGLPLYAVS